MQALPVRPLPEAPIEACPFCSVPAERIVWQSPLVIAIRDGFPVSPGHTLVIPRRHVETYFEASAEEQAEVWSAVEEVKRALDAELAPAGYNVGFNAGRAAGQTVMHLHVHVIPRYVGDVEDPRGGVRGVIPGRQKYAGMAGGGPGPRAEALTVGGQADPFARHLKPLFAGATDIAIVAAFVQLKGLRYLDRLLDSAQERGARVRLLTGDYLEITQVEALRALLDRARGTEAVASSTDVDGADTAARQTDCGFEARVVEVAALARAGAGATFHPKAWRFEGPGFGTAFVGSSNLSFTALNSGVEWNLRVDRERDPGAYERVVTAFDALWTGASPLSEGFIDDYAARVEAAGLQLPPGEQEAESKPAPPTPNEFQAAALVALAEARKEGRRRALVVLATGLGKTWLAAMDCAQVAAERGKAPRVLFLAHRSELLDQAARTFRTLWPDARFGWCAGERWENDADVVLASVQKLSRPESLLRIGRESFDYMIVDEVHHAAADSYRRVLRRVEPQFLLGLTATPDRADDADILSLFDHFEAYRADLGAGVEARLLVPFRYQGLKDPTDYQPIPWRNRRFDPVALAAAVQTHERMERLWEAWRTHAGTRTLVFCASVAHACFARDWLRARGQRVEAVFSGEGSADRASSLEGLSAGTLDAICAVDLFNEGVDVPLIDRVVMLRPTESPVLFLQQLGRGLRTAAEKSYLQVIDFVGNHRVFLERLRTLLSLGGAPANLRAFLESTATPELPPGCSVDVELEAIELLQRFLPRSDQNELVQVYREVRDSRAGDEAERLSMRPTAGEMFRRGYSLVSLRHPSGWFGFVADEADLGTMGQRAAEAGAAWFRELETTPMTRSFKMVVLQVLLDAGRLREGMALSELAARAYSVISRSPELLQDIAGVKELSGGSEVAAAAWQAYWRKNPVRAWLAEDRASAARVWFVLEGEHFAPRFPVARDAEPLLGEAFDSLTRELVDYRLAQYRQRGVKAGDGSSFEAKVISNQRDPILKLPDRKRNPAVPVGPTEARLVGEGGVWLFDFVKIACNVARPVGTQRNQLPDLLRRWFGPSAGRPGTAFYVRFQRGADGWRAEPVETGGQVIALPPRGEVIAFPTLRAAAGASSTGQYGAPEQEEVRLPGSFPREKTFAVRASGDSMDGGREPIRDGDWLVFRYARASGVSAVEGKVALVALGDPEGSQTYHVKRVVREAGRVLLRSDNPAAPALAVEEHATVIAVLVACVRPESLAPAVGTLLQAGELADAFGLPEPPRVEREQDRRFGHLFLSLSSTPGDADAAARAPRVGDLRPGETAFLLVREEGAERWRYAGVAHWRDERWQL